MKKLTTLFFVLLMASAVTVEAQDAAPVKHATAANVEASNMGPKGVWDTKTLNLCDVKYRVPKEAEFTLTNSGNEPLLNTYTKASCGCTNLKYLQEHVLPGNTTKHSVTYNGSGNDNFRKSITVQTNADLARTSLQIKGVVIREEATKAEAAVKK